MVRVANEREFDTVVDAFFKVGSKINTQRVVNFLLYIFEDNEKKVLFEHHMVSVKDMGMKLFAGPKPAGPSKVWIWFRGGPTGDTWYKGTLLHLLLDRYFMAAANGNTSAAEALERVIENGS